MMYANAELRTEAVLRVDLPDVTRDEFVRRQMITACITSRLSHFIKLWLDNSGFAPLLGALIRSRDGVLSADRIQHAETCQSEYEKSGRSVAANGKPQILSRT